MDGILYNYIVDMDDTNDELRKTDYSGIAAWLMAFAYICGLIAQKSSVNQNAEFSKDSPVLELLGWRYHRTG